jgi:hypothetical protein
MYGHLNNSFMNEFEPSEFYLSQNYPNPFRDKTTIKYCVACRTRVLLKVFNAEGKEIEKLVDEEQNPGTYEVEYTNVETGHAPSPQRKTFTYRLEADNYKCEMKMELNK